MAAAPSQVAERRIGWLTPVLGAAAAAVTFFTVSPRSAAGVAGGTVLAWLSFRWLRQALDAMTQLATAQAGAARPHISPWVYFKFFLRYVLMAAGAYVMISRFRVPVVSILAGLLMLGAATMAVAMHEMIFRRR